MKVHLIKKQSIEDYVKHNAQSKRAFEQWLSILKRADWNIPSEIISTFNTADILGNGSNRVIFNVGGNKYRMICKYNFGETKAHLFVKWIGTHSDYTTLCKEGEQYIVCIY